MGIGRGEMGSEGCKENGVKFLKTTSSLSTNKLSFDIPEWLLVEVLIRMPVKLVFRSKLVSKQWLSLISDPSFKRMYICRASISPQLQTWTFISSEMNVDGYQLSNFEVLVDVYSLNLKLPCIHVLSCPLADHTHWRDYIIGGISNGLVLFVPGVPNLEDLSNYNIYNPVTGECIALPPHDLCFKYACRGFVTLVENGVLTSYRVVCHEVVTSSSSRRSCRRGKLTRFKVFISEIDEWKHFNVYTDQALDVVWCRTPTDLNGILHWIIRKHEIIAYDPYQKPDCLRFIATPSDADSTYIGFLGAHHGRMRYFEVSDIIGVWILNDYVTGEWCLHHKINFADVRGDVLSSSRDLFFSPISFHPFDSEIVYLECRNIIISYNMKTRKLETYGGPLHNFARLYWLWTYLLVVPPWPISINPVGVL